MECKPMRGDPARFVTAHGNVTSMSQVATAAAVAEQWSAQLRPYYPPGTYATIAPATSVTSATSADWPVDAIDVRDEHVWVNAPDCSRVEGRDAHGRPFSIVVGREAWAEYTSSGHLRGWPLPHDPVQRFFNPQHRETVLALLEPWRLVHGYALEVVDEVTVAGRQGFRYRGRPTADARAVYESGREDEPLVYAGAEAAEFVIDAERGVVLRWSGLVDGAEYETMTFSTIHFDEPLDDWLFDPALLIPQGHTPRGPS